MVSIKWNRTRFWLMAIITLAVLSTVFLLGLTIAAKHGIGAGLIIIAPGIVMVGLAAWMLLRVKEGIDQGLPLYDERSQRLKEKAGLAAFVTMIYLNLAISWYQSYAEDNGMDTLIVRHAMSLSILGGAMAFFLFWGYYSRKGDPGEC